MDRSLKEGLSGMISGLVHIFFYPLDLIRAHLIVSEKQQRNLIPHYKNSIQVIKKIYTSQGIQGLYQGFYFTILNSVSWSVYFFLFEHFRHCPLQESEISKLLIASATAISTKFVLNPLTVVKTRVMLSQAGLNWYSSTKEAIFKIYKVDGIKGYWSGFLPGIILSLNGGFSLYFYQKYQERFNKSKDWFHIMLGGGLSKVMASSLFYPIFTMRIKLQQEQKIRYITKRAQEIHNGTNGEVMFRGLFDCFKQTWSSHGIKGFYRGFGITVLRLAPEYSLFFLIYESTSKCLSNKE